MCQVRNPGRAVGNPEGGNQTRGQDQLENKWPRQHRSRHVVGQAAGSKPPHVSNCLNQVRLCKAYLPGTLVDFEWLADGKLQAAYEDSEVHADDKTEHRLSKMSWPPREPRRSLASKSQSKADTVDHPTKGNVPERAAVAHGNQVRPDGCSTTRIWAKALMPLNMCRGADERLPHRQTFRRGTQQGQYG